MAKQGPLRPPAGPQSCPGVRGAEGPRSARAGAGAGAALSLSAPFPRVCVVGVFDGHRVGDPALAHSPREAQDGSPHFCPALGGRPPPPALLAQPACHLPEASTATSSKVNSQGFPGLRCQLRGSGTHLPPPLPPPWQRPLGQGPVLAAGWSRRAALGSPGPPTSEGLSRQTDGKLSQMSQFHFIERHQQNCAHLKVQIPFTA